MTLKVEQVQESSDMEKRPQKALLLAHLPEEHAKVREALRQCGREKELALLVSQMAAVPRSGCSLRRRVTGKK